MNIRLARKLLKSFKLTRKVLLALAQHTFSRLWPTALGNKVRRVDWWQYCQRLAHSLAPQDAGESC